MEPTLTVQIDRDSVHPGDDLEAHVKTLNIHSSTTISEFLQHVRVVGYLASIIGGQATWIVTLRQPGAKGRYIGVVAQQWQEPKLTIPTDTPLKELLSTTDASIDFCYWCQADPERVFLAVLHGTELPDKYQRG